MATGNDKNTAKTHPTPAELQDVFLNTFTPHEQKIMAESSSTKMKFILPEAHNNEVYPGIILGDRELAIDIEGLKSNKITHVLNTAQGKKFTQIDTNAAFYAPSGIEFHGFEAMDVDGFKLKKHFVPCADFIDQCLKSGGKIYVHCYQGLSRSASIVIAFLVLKRGMNVTDAAVTVRTKRAVLPNGGFLRQLCELNNEVYPTNTVTDSK